MEKLGQSDASIRLHLRLHDKILFFNERMHLINDMNNFYVDGY